MKKSPSFRELPLYVLNEHLTEVKEMVALLKTGKTLGLLSDAGLPCLADPGSSLVYQARQQGVEIQVTGVHSSLIYALISSGLSQQAFYFAGYLPKENGALKEKLKRLEKFSAQEKTTLIFIETPYRNEVILKEAVATLLPDTEIAYAQDLGSKQEHMYVTKIKNFSFPEAKVKKAPAVFIIRA